MRVGTKSLLFGAHCLLIHPFFVAVAWWKLYGFPWDPRLWLSFFLHDIGYFGCKDMDGEDGIHHPIIGAAIMGLIFGDRWFYLCVGHSRYMCRTIGLEPSLLCYADKLAIALEPWWLYLPRARAAGELDEYRGRKVEDPTFDYDGRTMDEDREWFEGLRKYMVNWVETHTPARPVY